MGDVDGELKPVPARECEHMAALIKSAADLPPLLVSFFRLGAARNGWLVHGSLAGEVEADRARLAEAGLEIEALEAAGQLAILELDLTVSPEEWVDPWSTRLDEKLAAGFDALWFTRFPIDPTEDAVSEVLPFEAAWMDRFRGRRVVTLCPYITGGLTGARRASHAARVASVHDRVLDHG